MEDKNIEMYQEDAVEFPYSISSGAMGPCISIGVYDTRNKSGYMRHQPNADGDDDMEQFIKSTLKKVKLENAIVYVAGGSYDINDNEFVTPESVITSRMFVKDLVDRYFVLKTNVTFHWVKDNKTSELHLDTSNGKFRVEILDDDSEEYS